MGKYSLQKVKQTFLNNGYIPLFEEYHEKHDKLMFKDKRGYKYCCDFNNFARGHIPSTFGRNPFTIENIKTWLNLSDKPIELLSDEYISAKQKLSWKCKTCGAVWKTAWDNIHSGKGCPNCAAQRTKSALQKAMEVRKRRAGSASKYSINDIKKKLLDYNPNVEILSTEYKNAVSPLLCRCKKCGNIYKSTWKHLKVGARCRLCYKNESTGINHPRYDASKTDAEREKDRSAHKCHKWTKAVFEKDNYTCQCCGARGTQLRAHHIDGFNWAKARRTDVANGITLCAKCHDAKYPGSFHAIYGNGNNTRQQLEEYLKNNKKRSA